MKYNTSKGKALSRRLQITKKEPRRRLQITKKPTPPKSKAWKDTNPTLRSFKRFA